MFRNARKGGAGKTPPDNPLDRAAPIDVEITRAKTPYLKKAGRVILWALVIIIGVNGVQNIVAKAADRNAADAPVPVAGLTEVDASAAAARFAADYLHHDPTVQSDGDIWAGTGWIGTDLVTTGAVHMGTAGTADVEVTARAVLAMPAHTNSAPAQQTVTPNPARAQSAIVPKGYSAVDTVWLPLRVPVVRSADGQVTALTPVFSADPPADLPVPAATDADATAATGEYTLAFFNSYASSDTTTQYMSSPGTALRGLDGAVTPEGAPTWTLSAPDATGARTGTATVTWSFAAMNVDLTVKQGYDLSLTGAEGRWFVNGITPHTTREKNL